MRITVQRPPADRQGPDIIDELLAADPAGVARGRQAIDADSSNRDLVACQCPAHSYMPTGSLASVIEAHQRWPGMIRYWSLTLTIDETGRRFTADTRLTIEKDES
jgi:hypothetical protein